MKSLCFRKKDKSTQIMKELEVQILDYMDRKDELKIKNVPIELCRFGLL